MESKRGELEEVYKRGELKLFPLQAYKRGTEAMNGYKLQSDSYRQYIEKHPDIEEEVKKNMESNIKVYDFLASCSKEERLELFNSSAFNDVVRGYFLMAIDNLKLDEETRSGLLNELRFLFDEKTADEAEAYYNTH